MRRHILNYKSDMLVLLLLVLLFTFPAVGDAQAYGQQRYQDEYEDGEDVEGPGIIIYRHADFRGASLFIPAGQRIQDLNQSGWNDKISSIELVGGARAVVYEHAYFRGATTWLRRDVEDLIHLRQGIPGDWNDKISSIKVFFGSGYGRNDNDDRDEDSYCTFFRHAGQRGSSFDGRLGGDRSIPNSWNDEVSSVWVRQGFQLTLYEHSGFRGRRVVLTGNDRNGSLYNLDNYRFNDQMSSYQLERAHNYRYKKYKRKYYKRRDHHRR